MIIGRSLLHKRVYVDREDPSDAKVRALSDRGYEIVELGGRPEALALKSDTGLCSGPTQYSARHCFGDPADDVVGKKYTLISADVEGRVIKDYSPFLMNVAKFVLYLFGKSYGVYDVVRVSTPAYDTNFQVALVTGGVVGQPIGLLSHTHNVDPEDVVGRDLNIVVDVPENDEIKAHVHDYAVMLIWYKSMVWPTEVLVAHTSKPLKPGNSGGPAYLKQ